MASLNLTTKTTDNTTIYSLTVEHIFTGIVAAADKKYHADTLSKLIPPEAQHSLTKMRETAHEWTLPYSAMQCLLESTGRTGFPNLLIKIEIKDQEHETPPFTIIDIGTDKIFVDEGKTPTTTIYLTPDQYGDLICLFAWGSVGAGPGDCT